jgi:thiamine-monophosphate kinase
VSVQSSEFDLIAQIRARAGRRDDVLLGIGDDAAILRVPAGHDLVVSTDTLNIGVHFPHDTAPSDIGWKALAVNLSDLAAMGATPAWCTLNLTMPHADRDWLDAFLDGFLELAMRHGVALVGGDTTRGPMSITVTVHGLVPSGSASRRAGAQIGDDVWVSGTLGDAAAGLALISPSPIGRGVGVRGEQREVSLRIAPHPNGLQIGEGEKWLRSRLDRPTPRVTLGLALRGIANACIDVSDGLLADLGHVLSASNIGAEIHSGNLPTSQALLSRFESGSCISMQLGGGDDYELCFTASPARAAEVIAAAAHVGVPVTRVGRTAAQAGLRLRHIDGAVSDAAAIGYRHFDEPGDAVDRE